MDAFDLDLQQNFCEIGCYRKADLVLERVLKMVWGRLKTIGQNPICPFSDDPFSNFLCFLLLPSVPLPALCRPHPDGGKG